MCVGEHSPRPPGPGEAQATPASCPHRPAAVRTGPPARRLWRAAAWAGGGLALVALFTRISMTSLMNSDGANNALQAWDMLHGHVLLHGWVIGDASYYTFELPQLAVAEVFFGLTSLACHIVSALTYVIVAALAVALARTGSRGAAAAARSALVLAVLAAPALTGAGVATLLEAPQHIGTSAFLLGSFLLIDRAPGGRLTAPLVGLILLAGQVGDATVLYVGVPAVVLVCAYHVLAAWLGRRKTPSQRGLRADAATAAAAVASVPLAMLVRVAIRDAGGFALVPPRTALSPDRLWWAQRVATWKDIRFLFGAEVSAPDTAWHAAEGLFGWACLLAAGFGIARLVWTWRSARRAEQLAGVTIAVNLGVYVVSTMTATAITSSREIAAVLPCGAVLAARACVPGEIPGAARGRLVAGLVALGALLPLGVAAAQPVPAPPASVALAASLRAHGLRYGIANYWDASTVTLQSGDQVQVRAVAWQNSRFAPYYWETRRDWYAAARHNATFVIADVPGIYPQDDFAVTQVEKYFGRPASAYRVGANEILIYRTNLLSRLAAPYVPSTTGKTE
jgi:hypothetical protein